MTGNHFLKHSPDGLAGGTSPMLDQYRRIKREHRENVLFFRLGDFYEMFAEDAVEVSSLLNLVLTSRSGLPMCGIPYHAARSYIARLLRCGKKIAICEQLSEPVKGKKVIDRQVVEVITPGTTVDEDYLDRGSSNYLAALSAYGGFCSFAYIDLSAGGFYATSFPFDQCGDRLAQELERLQVKEMLIQESLLGSIDRVIGGRPSLVLNRWADWLFDIERSKKKLERQFGLPSLKSFGLDDSSPELLSAGALLDYLDDTAKSLLPHVRSITVYRESEFVGIDDSSQRNLELARNLRDGDVQFSLLESLDETRCAMGKRLLKRRLLHPLRDSSRIQARLDMVEILFHDQGKLGILRDLLVKTPDLERLSSRLAMDKAHGKDMLAVRNALVSCEAVKKIRDDLQLAFESDKESKNENDFFKLMELRELLQQSICDDPSILLTEGNLIRDGYSSELDGLRRLKDSGRQMLEEYLEEEKIATGISSLKIRYNRLIGYFFEVTNVHAGRVPKHFIRRQGVVNGERFSTERLASLESDINGASDKIVELEKKLFLEIRGKAKLLLAELAAEACRIAELDVAQSLARAASIRGWVRPVIDNSNVLEIYEARHPVVEAHLDKGAFIPNDIILNSDCANDAACSPTFAMITGPNMAGKSTYLRSAALIVIMAQMGSFIPAREGRVGICDRVYCRVGASDNLARGESTFLVEMNETAYILNTATEKSLVIMDEVGRGTGTNDGLSIAWAVSEELLNRIKCRTFFATHYHELSLLPHARIANRSMEVMEKDGGIIFLRKLREGPTEESYGIHVAKLAGLSNSVIQRASEIMERMKKNEQLAVNSEHNNNGQLAICNEQLGKSAGEREIPHAVNGAGGAVNSGAALTGADDAVNNKNNNIPAELGAFLRELHFLDPNRMTPIDALGFICEWREKLTGRSYIAAMPDAMPKNALKIRENDNGDPTPSLFDI